MSFRFSRCRGWVLFGWGWEHKGLPRYHYARTWVSLFPGFVLGTGCAGCAGCSNCIGVVALLPVWGNS